MLKGRSSNEEATDSIQEFLLMKHLNLTPFQLNRLSIEDRVKYQIILNAILKEAPQLLGIMK